MPERSSLDVGVIGCGAIAQVVHLPILSRMPHVRVAAVCDDNVSKARSVAERFGIETVCADLAELLELPLAAVVICTPNHLHAAQGEAALRAGLDVLCERPLGVDREETVRLLQVAEESGRHLMVAHNHRFRPDAWALRQAIVRGELGEIFSLQTSWQRRRTRRPQRGDWRRDRERAGGGVLMDLGITNMDLGLWLVGFPEPERVTAYLSDRDEDGLEDSASVLLQLEGRLTFGVDVTWDLVARDDRHAAFVLGSKGSASLSPLVVHRETGGAVINATPRFARGTENVYTASYRRELDYFLNVVRGRSQDELPWEQEKLMRIVDACYESADRGREIVL